MISSFFTEKPIVMKIEIELYPANSSDPVVTTASSVSVTNDAGGEVSFKIEDWTHQCDDKVRLVEGLIQQSVLPPKTTPKAENYRNLDVPLGCVEGAGCSGGQAVLTRHKSQQNILTWRYANTEV